MIATTLQVQGDRELMAKFGALATRIQNRTVGRALKAGAKPIQQAAKSNMPVDTGAARRSISVKKAKSKKRGITQYIVYSKPGKIAQRKSTRKVKKGGYSGYYPAYLEHGTKRMPKRPWLQPAFSSRASQSAQIIGGVLRQEIEAVARGKAGAA